MRCAMLICGGESEWADLAKEELDAGMKETYAWFERWHAAGKMTGGDVLLECEPPDEAVEVASNQPGLAYRSVSVEVRPAVDHSGAPGLEITD